MRPIKLNKKIKKPLAIFLVLLISTLLFYTTPLHTYTGNGMYGAIVLGSVGSFAGFPGVMIGGTLGYFLGESEEVNAILPALLIIGIPTLVGLAAGGFKASGGTCNYYNAPEIANCEICNNKLMPCSEYYCKSIGQNCQYLKEEKKCVEVKSDDRTAPVIQNCVAKDLGTKLDYSVESSVQGCKVTNEVPAFSTLAVKFNLDEVAQCKIFSTAGKKFDDAGLQLDGGFRDKEHYLLFDIRNISLQTIEGCKDGNLCTGYIRCKDEAGNAMNADYFVNFKLRDAPDIAKPRIVETLVESGASVSASVSEVDFFMYVHEPSGIKECKYNKNSDIDISQMPETQKFDCENQEDVSKGGNK